MEVDLFESFSTYYRSHASDGFWKALVDWSGKAFIYSQDYGQKVKTAITLNGETVKIDDVTS